MLPAHGKMKCRACFGAQDGSLTSPHPDWRMVNDPGAWGRSEPEYLVLGFSKGATQAGIYESGRFDDVPFAGMRDRLTKALRAMAVLGAHETVDQRIRDPDSNIAFGSLIRCSVSRRDKKKPDSYSCTGPLIAKSFDEIPQVITACALRYLTELPSSIKAVLMLGNADAYVRKCQDLVRSLYPETFARINEMAVSAGGKLWVHLAHPSGLNGHFNTWLDSACGPGRKRIQAFDALAAQSHS